MKERLLEWVGQQVVVELLAVYTVDGVGVLESKSGRLEAVDGMGLVLIDEDASRRKYDLPVEEDPRGYGRSIEGIETWFIPWPAIAGVSRFCEK